MVFDLLVLVGAGLVVAVAEVGVTAAGSASRCQMLTRMERATATWALALPDGFASQGAPTSRAARTSPCHAAHPHHSAAATPARDHLHPARIFTRCDHLQMRLANGGYRLSSGTQRKLQSVTRTRRLRTPDRRIFVSLWSGEQQVSARADCPVRCGTGNERQPGYPGPPVGCAVCRCQML